MSSIADILSNKSFEEPPEVMIIKEFVRETLGSDVAVSVQERAITIHTPSASMAGALRPHIYALREMCQTKKRLIIRIG